MVGINAAVGEHDVVATFVNSLLSLGTQQFDAFLQAVNAIVNIKCHLHLTRIEAFISQVAQYI